MTTVKKSEVSALEALLNTDLEITEDVNIPRLGAQITVKALDTTQFKAVSMESIGTNGNVDQSKMFISLVSEAETTGLFRNAELMEKVNAYTPAECVEKTLLAGEIVALAEIILQISQFDVVKVAEQVKN